MSRLPAQPCYIDCPIQVGSAVHDAGTTGEPVPAQIIFGYLLGTFVGLVTIANPLSKIPLFMSLTGEMQRPVQKDNARRAAVYAFGLLTTCLFIGSGIRSFVAGS